MGLYSGMFLLPLFLQQYLGFPAIDSGLAQMPRSIAMGLTMPLAGNLYNRFGPCRLVGCGVFCTAVSFFLLSRVSLDVSSGGLIFPQILQGVGFGMTFVSVSTTAMASMERQQMMAASGLYNVFRQIFGSIGIALTATMFSRGENINRMLLSEHVSTYDPLTADRLATLSTAMEAKSGDPAAAMNQARMLLESSIMRQAGMLSFNRIYYALTLLFLCALPLVLLLQKRSGRAAIEVIPD